VLLDNARALILHHDPASREVVLHPRLHAFSGHWGFRVRAGAPYRARTKGKDERGVGYVKKNAIARRRFATWAELEAHLESWTREIADVRVHGTLGEPPIERFRRDAAGAPEVDRRPSAVRHDAGSGAPRRGRLRRRGRWQRLFGAMAPDRRTGAGDGAPARCASSTPAGWQRFTPSSRVVASGPSTTRT
jgi:hypothetical protein